MCGGAMQTRPADDAAAAAAAADDNDDDSVIAPSEYTHTLTH